MNLHLRGDKAAAPLKHGPPELLRVVDLNLRGNTAAAPLKRVPSVNAMPAAVNLRDDKAGPKAAAPAGPQLIAARRPLS